jgi:hypothetical protein
VIIGAGKAPAEGTTRGPRGLGSMNKGCREFEGIVGRTTRVWGAPNVPNTELLYGFFRSGLHSSN